MTTKIPGLPFDMQERLNACSNEIAITLDKYFPEFRESYKDKDFDARLTITLYIELIHAGFFKDKS
jgi:hypothetical protein